MANTRDIRIITLHKQHYKNEYGTDSLECQFSCWGYYDGIDVEKATGTSSLFDKKSNAPISETWYGLGKSIQKASGQSSCQNIGIFRCEDQQSGSVLEQFWEEHEKMPLFGVMFLQLKTKKQYLTVSQSIERKYNGSKDGKVTGVLSYCTFDNADLVILIQGNSLKSLEDTVRDISESKEVIYTNTVMGVSEKFLHSYAESKDRWKGYKLSQDEWIYKIRLNIVSTGTKNLKMHLKKQLHGVIAESISFYEVSGHEDLVVEITGTTVETLICFLLPEGIATHQNALYGRQIYNITTSVIMTEIKWEEIEEKVVLKKKKFVDHSWFRECAYKYSSKMEKVLSSGDESLYAYYQALIRTMNLLVQFEKFGMSKKIFYLIYPAFEMFERLLWEELQKDENNYSVIENIKRDMCDFLNSVNSLVYHIIHTDQMFLMIPGYSGTSFSIPIKMCSFYAWFVQKMVQILNDDSEYDHRCLLIPVMESKPETSLLDMNVSEKERIIKINLSQRTLYMPRHLMTILSHEVAHYVGNNLRNRKLRLECLIKTLAFVLTEGIMQRDKWEETDLYYDQLNEKWDRIYDFLVKELAREVKDVGKNAYHATKIEHDLGKACIKILMDENGKVYKEIHSISSDMMKKIKSNPENYMKELQQVYELQQGFDNNRKQIVAYKVIPKIVKKLLKVYKEVFSDIVAITVLGVDKECYLESFNISEGMIIPEKAESIEDAVRKIFADYIYDSDCHIEGVSENTESTAAADIILSELFRYTFTIYYLKKYIDGCKEEINKHVADVKIKQMIEEIQQMFWMFNGSKGNSCMEIYDSVQDKIMEYENDIKKLYQDKTKKSVR